MRASSGVKRGAEFLVHISTASLEERIKNEPRGKSRERLQAALLRRQDQSEKSICRILGYCKGTISNWLNRMQRNGIDDLHDGKSTGRRPKLTVKQQKIVSNVLSKDPTSSDFERSNWTANLLTTHIHNKFGVKYTFNGALALAHRLGFSVRVPRPVPHNTADREVVDKYVSETITAITSHVAANYSVGCMDAAGFAKAPFSARGIRPIGGHETVQTNFNKATTKALGALMEDELVLNFCDNANSDHIIELLEKLRQKYGRVFLICDNASAHKSEKIQKYLGETRGEVALWYLPPYTPQHNPIEIAWRELKRAIAGRYFDKFEEMHKTIRNLIKSGEVATCKLFRYMRDAITEGRNKTIKTPTV